MRKTTKVKQYDELTFTDDFMFCKVVCVSRQKSVEITTGSKGVRFDVYIEDDADTIYDIEMQAVLKKDIPKRSRYYQGMIDLNMIEKGARYSELRRSFVIFICLSDPFKKNLPIYRFSNRCDNLPELELGDGAYKVFVNASCTTDDMSDELKQFFDYLCWREVKGEFVRRIECEVDRVRKHDEWRLEYMTWNIHDFDKKEEGMLEKGMICYLNALAMNISKEVALRIAAITEEEALEAEQLRKAGEI